ncbi:MAG: hypothetical protein P1V51_25120 [Deltaproteobacteria bacterium]|nr:hypothetical protein [Deltaproteobacteria bacterium]
MFGLFRALGSAVIIGVGVKAGGDLYAAVRRRFVDEEAAGAEEDTSPVDEILASEDDDETREALLKEERARINKELDRIRRSRQGR